MKVKRAQFVKQLEAMEDSFIKARGISPDDFSRSEIYQMIEDLLADEKKANYSKCRNSFLDGYFSSKKKIF